MNEKMKMTADEFKEICLAILPHMNAIREIVAEKMESGDGASMSVNANGFMSFHPYNSEWEMNRYSGDGEVSISYSYREVLQIGGAENGD